jgi:hypothetical protein
MKQLLHIHLKHIFYIIVAHEASLVMELLDIPSKHIFVVIISELQSQGESELLSYPFQQIFFIFPHEASHPGASSHPNQTHLRRHHLRA